MKQEQKIVETKDYLLGTWVKGNEIIKTKKGDITVLELLNDFRSHLLQYVEWNKEVYHEQQLSIHNVSNTLILTPRDAEIFFNEIMSPKEANDALKKAMLKFINR